MSIGRKFKGESNPLTAIVPVAILFVVAFFTLSIGSVIVQDLGENFCTGTWITNTTPATGLMYVNPIYTASYGCCTTVIAGNNCSVWDTSTTSLNTSGAGLESLEEMSSWGPTLALVVIAVIIIGVLISYLGGAARD